MDAAGLSTLVTKGRVPPRRGSCAELGVPAAGGKGLQSGEGLPLTVASR
eukprot:CAMPEP_0119476674 /NCGR_PEP_ID=MMETSP1344-20130328/7098_1 /TAXON_ID=236787 /ORGANISM="Florenciella parvula, Strain CCMP2471" /LENGTH=48 /DNA_ID= /DNA_START= /DNA_END= /DNA_ORIENTATION=